MDFQEWMDYMLRRKAERAKDAKEMLRRNGEQRLGGLQMGGKTEEMSQLSCHFPCLLFEQVSKKKPMHVSSTYLTLSKPKDHPIHFVCTYKYKDTYICL